MEHSSGEATFSEPGVLGDLEPLAEPGDLGLLAELGDLGTVAVGLLWPGGGMAVCHTCWPDDMALSWRPGVSGAPAWSSWLATARY